MHQELVTSAEAATYLKTSRNTVYRWCRDGTLPGIKVGGVWRVPLSALQLRPQGGRHKLNLAWPDVLEILAAEDATHWMVVTHTAEDLYDVDASVISKGLMAGYRVIKGSWWQSVDEMRATLEVRGLDIKAAEITGALLLMDMRDYYVDGSVAPVLKAWQDALDGARTLGFRGIWKVGTPCLDDRAPIDGVMEVEAAAEKFFHREGARAICPVYTASVHPEWHGRLTQMLACHDVAVYRADDSCVVLRSAA